MTQGKIIFITGCSSGIGYSTALYLKLRGHRVICSARKQQDVERLRGEGYECLQLDLADSQSIRVAVGELLALTDGKLDAVFHNGAFGQPGAVEDLSRDVLRNQFETNFFGVHELTNLLLPVMRRQGHGRIIYNSSVLGFVAMKFRGAYNASKFALEGLVDTLRLELRGSGVKVVTLCPGYIRTPMTDINPYPMPFMLEPDEAARRMARVIARGSSFAVVPWQMAIAGRALKLLPNWLYDALFARAPHKPRQKD